MKLIIKYFKKYYVSILITVILVAGQVAVTLTVPKYMADMINVGIQQKGIQEFYYPSLREETYHLLNILGTKEDQNLLNESYKLENNSYELIKKSQKLEDFTIASNRFFMLGLTDKQALAAMLKSYNISTVAEIATLSDEQKEVLLKPFAEQKLDTRDKMIQANMIYQENQKLDKKDTSKEYLLSKGIEMLLVAISGMIFVVLVSYSASVLATSVTRDLRKEIFAKIESFSSQELEDFSTASLITRTITDTTTIQQLSGMCLRIGVMAPFTGIGAIIQSSTTSLDLLWIIAVVVVAFALLMGYAVIKLVPQFAQYQKNIDRLNLAMRENLSGLRVIRAFHTEEEQTKRFMSVNDEITDQSILIGKIFSFMNPSTMFIMNIASVVIVYFGANLINAGTLQIGSLLSFIQFSLQIMFAFAMTGMMFFFVPRLVISLERIDTVLTSKNLIVEPEVSKIGNDSGEVIFDNVSFSYSEESDAAIENLSFTAKKGKIIAFIGGTGSGKSTIGKLIQRLYDATSGNIYVDGENVKDYSEKELREKIGYVPQKSYIFSMSIADNIAYGSELDIEKVKKSAQIACAEEFIMEKAEQYDYIVEQRGANLSGGQKQRLQIARAIYKNPDILFFDDSFSALDYKTDARLRNNLKNEMKDTTILIVAQRIPTIMHADEIIVLDDGKVVGRGTHDELMKECSVYQEIASGQLKEGDKNE